ncbi:hypothetical protein LSAT2_019797 [Lamellibrachia satsuma]|nr:hypothetical protein LSAT2_019797 [Lamellibrachia satsuma]
MYLHFLDPRFLLFVEVLLTVLEVTKPLSLSNFRVYLKTFCEQQNQGKTALTEVTCLTNCSSPDRGGQWQTNPNAANNKLGQTKASSQPSCRLCFGALQACFVQSVSGHVRCTAALALYIYQCQGPSPQCTRTGLLSREGRLSGRVPLSALYCSLERDFSCTRTGRETSPSWRETSVWRETSPQCTRTGLLSGESLLLSALVPDFVWRDFSCLERDVCLERDFSVDGDEKFLPGNKMAGGRSFSALKYLENYLRPTPKEQRLNGRSYPHFDSLTSTPHVIVDTAGPFQRQIERTASYRLESDPEFQAPGKRDPDTHISGRKIRKCLGLILMVVVITTLVVAMMKTYGQRPGDDLPTTTHMASVNDTSFETSTPPTALVVSSMSSADVTST